MAAEPRVQFYLGANAPSGFYSLYDQLIDPDQAQDVMILKGGPGCGKSSLMRKVGAAMEEQGLAVEYIQCSGDPDSLDAVIIPTLATAIVDGTAPHGCATQGHFSGKKAAHPGLGHAVCMAVMGVMPSVHGSGESREPPACMHRGRASLRSPSGRAWAYSPRQAPPPARSW